MRTQFGGMKIAALVLILAFVCGIAPASSQASSEREIERCAATQHHLIILVGAVSRACRDGGIECRTPLTAAKGMSVILAPSQYK